jgi:hypothetical protein
VTPAQLAVEESTILGFWGLNAWCRNCGRKENDDVLAAQQDTSGVCVVLTIQLYEISTTSLAATGSLLSPLPVNGLRSCLRRSVTDRIVLDHTTCRYEAPRL